MKENEKNILIFSNNAFSKINSNGRTLMNLLSKIPSKNLAQFYISGIPDEKFCSKYFHVSDKDALNSFLHKHKKDISPLKIVNENEYKKPKKNLKNIILRDIVWQSLCWWNREFENFLKSFKPDIILLQAGDCAFMYAIARKTAKECNAKLIMFNTESYVLKKRIYAGTSEKAFFHKIVMQNLKYQYKLFMEKADFCIYNMEELENVYQKKYEHFGKSCSIYNSSELYNLPDNSNDTFSLLYCGNLGVGRDKPLDELAKILYEVDAKAKFDIYGKFTDENIKNKVCSNKNVIYHGFVEYSEIPRLMSNASMVIHCENDNRIDNLKYAFSTKIADCIVSTRPFLVYASKEYPFVKYLENNKCAHIASNNNELKEILKKCITDKDYRNKYEKNAREIAIRNHDLEKNSIKFKEIIENL